MASTVAFAGESNRVAISMKVNIDATPTCDAALVSARTGERLTELDFSTVYPHLIQDAPLMSADLSERSVMSQSNFNGVYDSQQATHAVRVSCDLVPSTGQVSIGFSDMQGGLQGDNGRIPLFKLTNTDINQDSLAFALYAKDRFSSSATKVNQFIKDGSIFLLQEQSFSLDSGVYRALLDLYPGLFWQTPENHNYQVANLQSQIAISVTFN